MNERDIFMAALDQATAEERAEYLKLACGGDSILRQRLEGLLRVHERSGEFLQKPLVEQLAEGVAALENCADTAMAGSASCGDSQRLEFLASSHKPGSLGRLGSYEIEEVIGTGGMSLKEPGLSTGVAAYGERIGGWRCFDW